MTSIESFFAQGPFAIPEDEKSAMLSRELAELTQWHRENCEPYSRWIEVSAFPNPESAGLAAVPYLPVRVFKHLRLASVPDSEIIRELKSSGTTGTPSQIALDKPTADLQARALAHIMKDVLGPNRLPMLVIDTQSVLRDRKAFSARGAGILGMSNFGRRQTYVLNDDMELDRNALRAFLERHGNEPFLIFGFTFMVWQYFLQNLVPGEFDLSNAVLVHSGGWKKLADVAVDNETFRTEFETRTGLTRVHNFYGMVEQVGSVFIEGSDGWLHTPSFADVVIRDPNTWAALPAGERGVIEVLSALPRSYPGHAILTEDEGMWAPADADSEWRGNRLRVFGRVPRAELRGCSDTHASAA
ncbi:MAG: acyl-protein synthetase [Candidatus Nanopelagicales bacterium]